MNERTRPPDCCTIPIAPPPFAADEREAAVAMFKALADPTRLEILWLIAAQTEPLCACDIVDRFALSQPTISHHLKILAAAGLISVSRQGLWAFYTIEPEPFATLRTLLTQLGAPVPALVVR